MSCFLIIHRWLKKTKSAEFINESVTTNTDTDQVDFVRLTFNDDCRVTDVTADHVLRRATQTAR